MAHDGVAPLSETEGVLDPAACDRLIRIGGVTLASQMLEMFLKHGQERIMAAEAGYASQDMRAVEHASHSMKSSAGNIGAVRMMNAAAAVEAAAEAGAATAEQMNTLRVEYDAAIHAAGARLAELQS
jgi:HPt (histidine-containing phosphotransfer) domain-containing protein